MIQFVVRSNDVVASRNYRDQGTYIELVVDGDTNPIYKDQAMVAHCMPFHPDFLDEWAEATDTPMQVIALPPDARVFVVAAYAPPISCTAEEALEVLRRLVEAHPELPHGQGTRNFQVIIPASLVSGVTFPPEIVDPPGLTTTTGPMGRQVRSDGR